MKHVTLPVDTLRPLPFYLALEEWVATELPEDDWFFTWQAPDAVIIGRHQDLHAEVDTDFCLREGIAVYRRRSGGGAVFADSGNLMFSFVTARSESLANAFAGFTTMLAGMLRTLGIDAAPGGRNDIYIGGAKVSGCAAYSLGNRKIAHGTMLHSVDTRRMAGALTPSRAKLARHGVSSVEARVTALSRHTTLSLAELRARAIATLTDGERCLTPAEVARVEALSQHYYDPQWTEGTALRHLINTITV
ncbi:MAG: lipoate--protein ligase family protein [Candidatus Amulumruptor caecigallinarius]|nr:lipoate--protein ligase family protein [Candidatus Amulumruptor caecigallinarius]MCM1396449.1 lipoate--protein ligase family protein [Candidatus Amulumruptor caecigallinarius]MCM1453494.1 lipoate--protein ligase family protein [bacterium]